MARTGRATLLVAVVILLVALAPPFPAQEGESEWKATLITNGLSFPVDVAFGPDGTLYYAELASGNVRAIPPGETQPLAEPVAHVDASPGGNGGFLGLALDPDFENTGAFFVYYTVEKAEGKVNRVSRVTADSETVLVDDIPWANMHDGGRLVFTARDVLVVTTGDNEKRDPAQDPESLLGKTLRMTREGEPAPDNPDPGSLVFTLGHRNPFGLALDRANGTLWVTENGPERADEVNILQPGGNYGWPHALGEANDPEYVDPVVVYEQPIGPTGATVLDGALYFGDFNFGQVHRVVRGESGAFLSDIVWKVPYSGGHVLDVETGPDGRLYVSTYAEIWQLEPPEWTMPEDSPNGNGESFGPPGGDDADTGDGDSDDTDGTSGGDGPASGDGGDGGADRGDDTPDDDPAADPRTRIIPPPAVAFLLAVLVFVAACIPKRPPLW